MAEKIAGCDSKAIETAEARKSSGWSNHFIYLMPYFDVLKPLQKRSVAKSHISDSNLDSGPISVQCPLGR